MISDYTYPLLLQNLKVQSIGCFCNQLANMQTWALEAKKLALREFNKQLLSPLWIIRGIHWLTMRIITKLNINRQTPFKSIYVQFKRLLK